MTAGRRPVEQSPDGHRPDEQRPDEQRPDEQRPDDFEGPGIELGNEFAEIHVRKVRTRNGARLLISAPRSGQWVALCPMELEALTWQSDDVFSAMLGHPHAPLPVEGAPGE